MRHNSSTVPCASWHSRYFCPPARSWPANTRCFAAARLCTWIAIELEGGKVRLYIGKDPSRWKQPKCGVSRPMARFRRRRGARGPAAARAPRQPSPSELADAAADRYGLPRLLVRSVMADESGFPAGRGFSQGRHRADAVDARHRARTGGRSARSGPERGCRHALPARPAGRSTMAGLWHALAAYNAGPGAVDKYTGRSALPRDHRVHRQDRPGYAETAAGGATP